MNSTYTGTATWDGKWWIIEVAELAATTQAHNVREIDEMASGLVTALLDLDEADPVEVDITVRIPTEVATQAWEEAHILQASADAAAARAATRRREAITKILDLGFSQVDTSKILGISPQRVQQLATKRTRNPKIAARKEKTAARQASTATRAAKKMPAQAKRKASHRVTVR